jgi:hypothetical protein
MLPALGNLTWLQSGSLLTFLVIGRLRVLSQQGCEIKGMSLAGRVEVRSCTLPHRPPEQLGSQMAPWSIPLSPGLAIESPSSSRITLLGVLSQ